MEYLIMWLCTIIMSFVIEFSVSFKVFKMAADNGYKVNLDKMSSNTPDSEEASKFAKIELSSLLIPIYNLAYSLKRYIEFNNKMDYWLDALNVQGALKEMSEKEKKKYNENPSMFQALMLSTLEDDDKQNEKYHSYIKFKDKKAIGYAEFEIDENLENIKIMENHFLKGAELTEEEIKSRILQFAKNYTNSNDFLKNLEKYNNKMKFNFENLLNQALENNIVTENGKRYSNGIKEETNKDLLRNEKKKQLLTLKREILSKKYIKKQIFNNKIIKK